MKHDELTGHKLFEFVLPKIVELYFHKARYNERTRSYEKRDYDLCDKYLDDVFGAMTRIQSTVQQLEEIYVYFRHFPSNPAYKKKGILRPAYWLYHLENYYFRASSLIDKMLHLINSVHEFGIPQERVNLSLIANMRQLEGTQMRAFLEAVKKGSGDIRKIKNIVAHYGNYSDEKLTEISTLSLMVKHAAKIALSEHSEGVLKVITRIYQKDKLAQMRKNNEEIRKVIARFFDLLYPEVERRIKEYQRLSGASVPQ